MNPSMLNKSQGRSTKGVKHPRAKPDNTADLIFWWLVKAGAIPGSVLILPLLPAAIFLSMGLIYHYGQMGGSISGVLVGVLLIFTYTLRHLALSENKLRLRLLGIIYLSVGVSLPIITLAFQLWVFN